MFGNNWWLFAGRVVPGGGSLRRSLLSTRVPVGAAGMGPQAQAWPPRAFLCQEPATLLGPGAHRLAHGAPLLTAGRGVPLAAWMADGPGGWRQHGKPWDSARNEINAKQVKAESLWAPGRRPPDEETVPIGWKGRA